MATTEPTWEQTNPRAWIYREPGDTHCFGFVVRDEDTFSALLMLPSPERVRPTHDLGDFATLPAAQRQVEAAHSYLTDIAKALATQGGHLSIGRGGFTLHYENCRLSGYDETLVLALARALKLPIIDTRTIPDDDIVVTSIRAPLPAVNREPDPEPYHGLAYAPLAYLAAHYAQAGARVENLPLNPAQAGA